MMFTQANVVSELTYYTKRVFIINGKTKDFFVMPDYRYLRFELLLHEHLTKGLGYSSVAFIDHEGLFFWDAESANRLMIPKSTAVSREIPKNMMRRQKNITTKPFDQSVSNAPDIKLRYDYSGSPTEIITKVRDMLKRYDAGHTAVVVLEKSLMLNIPKSDNVMVDFIGFLKDTMPLLPASNKNILIFIENSESEWNLSESYRKNGLEDIFSCSSEEDKVTGIASYVKLLTAEKRECSHLLGRLRIVEKKEIDLVQKEKMSTMIACWIKESNGEIHTVYAKLLSEFSALNIDKVSKILNRQSEKSAEEQMNEITGMEDLKKAVRLNIKGAAPVTARVQENVLVFPARFAMDLSAGNTDAHVDHFALLGNPGTGKTKVARIIAKLLQEKGILPTGHFIEATPKDLISDHIGGTAIKTRNMIERALGGVLFIDEAYAIKQDEHDQFGSQCLATLVEAMSSLRGRFVLIMAGYKQEMLKMIEGNRGMKRRLKILEIPDYDDKQLAEIMKNMIKKHDHDTDVIGSADAYVANLFKEKSVSEDWGNAGAIEEILQEAVKKSRKRNNGRVHLSTIDFSNPNYFEEICTSGATTLDSMIGQDDLKKEIKKIVSTVKLSKNNNSEYMPGHYFFTGNPGTGKSTVAGIMANEFYNCGVLKTPRLVSKSANDLIGCYVGHSEDATKKTFQSALGGVLFIDEAHQLVNAGGNNFGSRVLETLIPLLESHRKEIIVIFAGYPEPMERLFDYDAGLRGRIANKIHFRDYTPNELLQIFKKMMASEFPRVKVPEEYSQCIVEYFERIKLKFGKTFDNARAARNFMDKLIKNYAYRVDHNETEQESDISKEDIKEAMKEIENDHR